MNKELIEKYFQDNCTEEELEIVMEWFKTAEGQEFLEKDIENEYEKNIRGDENNSFSEIDSDRIFRQIESKMTSNSESYSKKRILSFAASILITLVLLYSVIHLYGDLDNGKYSYLEDFVEHKTLTGEQATLKLRDGTTIKLNEESVLKISKSFLKGERLVQLEGEAFFDVEHNPEQKFIVEAAGALIKVLGTRFNVKVNPVENSVAVSVNEGKVSLNSRTDEGSTAGTTLIEDQHGTLWLKENQISVQHLPAVNYLSWFSNRLIFEGESLEEVSKQLEHIYNTEISFEEDELKEMKLTANIEGTELVQVLNIISNTFDIDFKHNGKRIIWNRKDN